MVKNIYPIIQAIVAAGLFGASAPFAKLLLGEIAPIPLAALLYLGSGIGLALYRTLKDLTKASETEAQIKKADIPWLIGAIAAGGVAAPILMMLGLAHTPAATASLLLNFESVATTLIGAMVFKEAVDKRVWGGVILITFASILLSQDTSASWGLSLGALGIVAACILWGIDNNCTRNISAKDPLAIVTTKGIAAGSVSFLLALVLGSPMPSLQQALVAMFLGVLGYGFSIVLFILAMRNLGATRTSAFFSTAPFVGAVLSFILFAEKPNALFYYALPVMLAGVVALLTENHCHNHIHTELEHEHGHSHDDSHHDDHHAKLLLSGSYHSHWHRHEPCDHAHHHAPDIHHRHAH